jgi:mono/diheme cytochrome c family protein
LLVGLSVAAAVTVLAVLGIAYFARKTDQKPPPDGGPAPGKEELLAQGKHLYGVHCAQCHGEKGDGNGPAARYLYPKPRNFAEAKFRLVTTENKVPSDKDLMQVITRGMPGSAMVPFGHLSESDRQALVAQVRQLTREALVERFRQEAAQQGGRVDLAELTRDADQWVQPGETLQLPPDFPLPDSDSVARGRQLYVKAACAACHGDQGKGDGVQDQRNDDGMPTRPRDLTRGFFKGGPEPQQLYARIMLGIPGTPMPASSTVLKPGEVGDVINYVLSLSDAAARAKVEHKRTQLVARRVKGPLPDSIPDSEWQLDQAVPIVVSPLWWREYAEPGLQVAAVHDGRTLAVRLTWQDESRNDTVSRPEDFEDMAAVQLFKGAPEPFLGMGSEAARIDLWQWRAGWQRPFAAADSELDDYPFDTPLYRDLLKGKDKAVPDFLTARAAGNQVTNADRAHSASSLAAKGFGSTTFRPRASQLVKADATWKEGRWTVVLRRPLAVGPEEGTSLAAGETCSAAFAIWDGAARDRNGQKLISIWHDLKVE